MERNSALRRLIRRAGVTKDKIEQWKGKVWQAYLDLARDLPDVHVWKEGKLKHALHGMKEAQEHAELLGLEGVEIDVIGFLFFAHDVGRLSQALRAQRDEPSAGRLHGIYSVQVLIEHLEIFYVTSFWRAIFSAIAWHAEARNPTLKELRGDRAALALTTLLRDMDKREGFLKAKKYTQDGNHKRGQMEANWPKQRKTDPTWGEEKGRVEPSELLDRFCEHKPIERDSCQSYEAYMLQYLGWLFDVTNLEIRELIIKEGGPHIVLAYLRRQLYPNHSEQYTKIARVMAQYGVLLLCG